MRRGGHVLPARAYLVLISLACSGSLAGQALGFQTEELPWAIKSAPYHAELTTILNGECPASDVRLRVSAGRLPRGIRLFNFGFEGTPEEMGRFWFTVTASNTCASSTKDFDLLVTGKPILVVWPRQIRWQYREGSVEPEDVLTVQGSWPNLPYSMDVSSAPWMIAQPAMGKIPDEESAFTGDRVSLRASAANLSPGTYHALLKFYTTGGESAPMVDVTLEVLKSESATKP
jgi:hypothetical protein